MVRNRKEHKSRAIENKAPASIRWVPNATPTLAEPNQKLFTLAELSWMAGCGSEPERLIGYVVEAVADLLAVKFVGVGTWDEGTGNLLFRGGRGWAPRLAPRGRVSAVW